VLVSPTTSIYPISYAVTLVGRTKDASRAIFVPLFGILLPENPPAA